MQSPTKESSLLYGYHFGELLSLKSHFFKLINAESWILAKKKGAFKLPFSSPY